MTTEFFLSSIKPGFLTPFSGGENRIITWIVGGTGADP